LLRSCGLFPNSSVHLASSEWTNTRQIVSFAGFPVWLFLCLEPPLGFCLSSLWTCPCSLCYRLINY
jgi:hypothetical protein